MRKKYRRDITRERFETVRPFLEGAKKRTRPRKVDLYDVFCAVLYVLKTGCGWRDIPQGFPEWELVYYYWGVWSRPNLGGENEKESLVEAALKKCGYRVTAIGLP